MEGKVYAPMSETEKMFSYEIDEKIANKFQYHSARTGKWVLFYRKQSMDKVWKEVCKLYHEEQLEGIEFLKTSTAKFNDRLKDSDLGMISFICGPSGNLERIAGYGMALLKTLHRHNLGPFDVDSMPYIFCGDTSPDDRNARTTNTMIAEIGIPVQWISQHCLTSLSHPQRMRWALSDDRKVSPTKETRAFYLHEYDEDIATKYQYEQSQSGKWMLYYHTKTLNLMWTRACKLYKNGELEGVKYLKVSTARSNPRHHVPDMGVILFYCGPSNKEKLMRSYAKGIIKKMLVIEQFDQDQIQYEIDHRNELFMRAPKDNLNCIYNLVIPRVSISDAQRNFRKVGVSTEGYLPSQVLDEDWLTELNESICFKWICRNSLVGHWLMVYEEALLDEAWKKVRDLYRRGQLTGIQYITVSTAKLIKKRGDELKLGFISCFCGPSNNVELVKTFGDNLANLTSYSDAHDKLAYKFNKETICHVGEQKVGQQTKSVCSLSPPEEVSDNATNTEWVIFDKFKMAL